MFSFSFNSWISSSSNFINHSTLRVLTEDAVSLVLLLFNADRQVSDVCWIIFKDLFLHGERGQEKWLSWCRTIHRSTFGCWLVVSWSKSWRGHRGYIQPHISALFFVFVSQGSWVERQWKEQPREGSEICRIFFLNPRRRRLGLNVPLTDQSYGVWITKGNKVQFGWNSYNNKKNMYVLFEI